MSKAGDLYGRSILEHGRDFENELPMDHEDRGWTDYQMMRGLGWL